MRIKKHHDTGWPAFLKRTVSAQLHLLGALAFTFGLIYLLRLPTTSEHPAFYWCCWVYGMSGIVLFATSATYHFLDDGFILTPELKFFLEDLDHFAIYIFTAGTYTPFLVGAVADPWKTILLYSIWIIAITGILYTSFKKKLPQWMQNRYIYTGIFILMGWVAIVRIGEIYNHLSWSNMFFLIAGGLSYTLGAVFYATKKPNLIPNVFGFHELWHIMVLLGAGFHFFMIRGLA